MSNAILISKVGVCDTADNTIDSKCRIASVVLTHNSDADIVISLPQLRAQKSIDHSVIIVDNASTLACLQRMQTWLRHECPDAVIGTISELESWIRANPAQVQVNRRVYLVLNPENRGYSAGNNVGIRLAERMGAGAVLIANPDMRIDNPHYIADLTQALFADEKNYIAASRIIGIDGKSQNPLRESTFWEEFTWPRSYFGKLFGGGSYVLSSPEKEPICVPKVSGCCLMLRMSFLKATDYLDENVFLYCEEPILSARSRMSGGRIIYAPKITAIHAHVRGEKGNTGKRMLLFIKSRKYYLENYSGYNWLQLQLLSLSYGFLALLNRVRGAFDK